MQGLCGHSAMSLGIQTSQPVCPPPVICRVSSSRRSLHAHNMAAELPGFMSQLQAGIRGRTTLFIQERRLFLEVPLHLIDQNCDPSHCLLQEKGLLSGSVVKNPPALKRRRLDPWVGKIPWRRVWPPTPAFLPGKSHGQRSLGVQSPGLQRVGHD